MHTLNRAVRVLILLSAVGLACAASAETLRMGGSSTGLAVMRKLVAAYRVHHPDVQVVFVPDLSGSGGIKATIAGAIDIGLGSRELKEEERKQGVVDVQYGSAPWVFVTPLANPLNGLSTKDVVDIYTRKRTQWPNGNPIRLVVAPVGDSDNKLLARLSPEMDKAVDALPIEQLIIGDSDTQQAEMIERIPNTFGATSLAIVLAEQRRIKPLALNGVVPSPRSLAAGKYPLSKSYRLVIRSVPTSAVRQFADFVRSAEGRALLERYGHWPTEK